MIPAKQVTLAAGHYALKGYSELWLPTTLSAISTGMERRGAITQHPGENYAQNVLARLTGEYLSTGENKL